MKKLSRIEKESLEELGEVFSGYAEVYWDSLMPVPAISVNLEECTDEQLQQFLDAVKEQDNDTDTP